MKKIFLLVSMIFTFVSVKSQDCNGVSCIANPNIIQEEIVICYTEEADSVFSFCESSVQVCELTEYTYVTPYHLGSIYNWTVIGGQIINTTPSGNTITILWDSLGVGMVGVTEEDSLLCSQNSVLNIQIIPNPIAEILTSTSSNIICVGSTIQFQGVDLNNGSINQGDICYNSDGQTWPITDTTQFIYDLQYSWDFGDGSTSLDQNPIHMFSNPGLYTVSLSISNSCQCFDVVTYIVEVVNSPGPSITSCIGPLCEGDTAEYCTDAIIPAWEVVGGTIYNSSSTNNCIAVIWDNTNYELDDGGGEVLVADLNSNCGTSQSFYNVPIIPFNPIIKGNEIVCPGAIESYSFECIPGVEYNWSVSTTSWSTPIIIGNSNESDFSIEFDVWNSGYTCQIVLDMYSTTLNCPLGQVLFDVQVLPRINSIWVNTDICENDVVTYTDGNGVLYDWTVVNGSVTSSTVSVSQIDVEWDQGDGNAMIIVEPIQAGLFCETSKSFPISISKVPDAAIDIIGNALICPGENYIYSAVESNASAPENLSYNWLVTGGVTTTTNGASCLILWDPIGPYSISVTNNLLSTPYCSSPAYVKNINTVPVINPVIIGSATACLNSISTFDLSTIYPSWAVVNWSVSNSNLGSVVSGQGTGQVQVEWGNQSGLTDIVVDVEVCGVVYSSVFPISFISQSVSFSVTNSPICSESSLAFVPTLSGGDFVWDFGDNTTSTQEFPNQIYDAPGSYLVSLQFTDATTQCISSYTTVVTVEGISGKLLPEGISYYCGSLNINQPLYISTISNSIPSVEWFHDGVSISTSSNHTVNSTPPNQSGIGDYSVVLTDAIGCSNTLNIITIDTVDCSGGGGWCGGGPGCPSLVPVPYTSSCNSGLGTMSFNFSSPTGGVVDWRVDNGSISSSVNNLVTFDDAGIYNVKCSSAGCLIGKEQITVPLIVDVYYSSVCDPSNANQITYFFQDSSSYLLGYGTATYLWDFGDGNTSTTQNPNHVYTSNGTYVVNLTVNYGSYSCNKSITLVVAGFNVSYSYTGLECENTPTITFSSVASPTVISSWSWDFGDGASSGREAPQRTYNPSNNYNTSLVVTDENGCVASSNMQITIEQNPLISSVVSLGPYCSNDAPIDLSANVNYIPVNGEISSWAGTGVDYDPISQIYYFDPMLAGGGSHNICVIVTDNNGCYDKECIIVDVLCPEKPKVFGESEYCYSYFGINTDLNTQSIFTSYQWYKDGVALSSTTNYLYDYPAIGSFDYTVEVEDDNGCIVLSEPFNVNVNDVPSSVWTSVNINPCPGEDIVLSHSGTQASVDYYWNTLPQQTDPVVNVIAIPDFEYTVTAVNEFGCESVSNPIVVPSEIQMCHVLSGCLCDDEIINSSGQIDISGLSNTWQYSSYEWLLNGISFAVPQTNSNLIIDPTDPNYTNICMGEITLEVTDINSCTSISNPLTIEPNCSSCLLNNFEVNIAQTICYGDSSVIGSNVYYNPGTYLNSFQTTIGCDSNVVLDLSVMPFNSSTQNILLCLGDSVVIGSNVYYNSSVFSDTLISSVGCDSVLTTQIDLSDPIANLTFFQSTLTATSLGGVSPFDFEIGDLNGPIISSISNAVNSLSYNPISNGTYYCIVIDDNGCVSDTVFYQVNLFPNLIEESVIGNLSVYPNPSNDYFNISFDLNEIQDLKVRILNMIGEKIFFDNLDQFNGKYDSQIDLSSKSKGIYFLEIETNNGVINQKLILQ